MSDIQQQVQEAIDRLVESGAERGVQVAVYRRGELVVNAVAGIADPATGRPVTSDTPFYNFSIGQGYDGNGGACARRTRCIRLRHADRRVVAGVRVPTAREP